MANNPKSGALAILALQRRPPGGRLPPDRPDAADEGDGADDDGLQDAMADLAGAMREGDTQAMAEAFRAAMEIAG